MSIVTNLLLTFSISEDEPTRMKEVNWFQHRGRDINLTSADFSIGGMKSYDGSKNMEAILYIGVYNHFNLEEFITYLSGLRWKELDRVQLIVKEEEDEMFKILYLNGIDPNNNEQ